MHGIMNPHPSRPTKIEVAVCALLSILAISAGCGASPSQRSIQNAITNTLQKQVPVSLGGALLGERNIVVEQVRVLQTGSPQGEQPNRFWPVRVHVKGTYVANWDGKSYTFDRDAEYLLRTNAYDEWVATLSDSSH